MWDTLEPVGPSRKALFYERGWWRAQTFLDDLRRTASQQPGKPAVIAYEQGLRAKTLSYAELARTADRFAGALTELGVRPGDVVVVHLPNWWMLTPLYLACARMGAVVASVNPPFGGRELGHLLRDTRARVCVVADTYNDIDYAGRLLKVAPDTLGHRVVVGDAAATGAIDFYEFFVQTPWEERHRPDSYPARAADEVMQLVYTSGTTGQPKGVAHSFNTMWAATRAFSDIYQLGGEDVIAIPHYLTHLAASCYSVWMSIALGATCVMQDTTDMELLLDLIEAHGVTLVFGAPVYQLGLIAGQRAKPRDISTLRCLNTGAAPVPPPVVAQAREVLGVRLDSNFGMTECGAITITRAGDPEGWAAHSDGSPVDWMEVQIVAEPGEDVGRLLIRGASLTLGYLNQRDAFLASLDEDGWFDTGDTARPDGRGGIRLTGRRVDLIIRETGLLVPTLEVEALLLQHPAVTDVVLIGYPHPQVPGAEKACAVVVPAGPPPGPALAELRQFLDDRQVAARDWPDRLEIVTELPRNAQGKVLRRELRKEFG